MTNQILLHLYSLSYRSTDSKRPLMRWLSNFFVKITPVPNLAGDRDVEWSWIVAHLDESSGNALDVGGGQSNLGLVAALRGYKATVVDLTNVKRFYAHSNLSFIQNDLFNIDLPDSSFDLIIACSTVEHIGLPRYGGDYDMNADLRAMSLLRRLVKPNGTMLMTIPVGKDKVVFPEHRVYGSKRLPMLLDGWDTEKKDFFIKDIDNKWIAANEYETLNQNPTRYYYGLGLFILKPKC